MKNRIYYYIDTEDALKELLPKIKQAERIAVDTESNSLHCYYDKVCLIQIGLGEENYIIDPLVGLDLSRFLKLLAEKPLIFHAADNDLRLLHTQFGFFPKRLIFDTMLAAKLSGHEQMGLAALGEKYFHIDMPKTGQKANWARRPLVEDLKQYASDDTRYLHRLADKLFDQLKALGREEWFVETCERMVQGTTEKKVREADTDWRMSGSGALKNRKQLVFVKELWHWREDEAQKVDKPPFMIMGNQQLLNIANWAVTYEGDFKAEDIPKLPGHCTGKRLAALQKHLQKAAATPEEKWPVFRKPKPYVGPDFKPEIESLREECAVIAKKLKLDPSVLAPKATIVLLARHRATSIPEMMACSPIMKWQAELLEEAAKKVLQPKKN